ncbi:hypothetical protein C2E21_0949 [Chlorella sorokiniana]|uniref:Expansin-like EG45 domain-containing protein n=1 Tax=Chlorella sorokiniana TaxID=3076 RepID=A0A2P6U2X2_CHLSO|nr:hypothetical protein C2E21_0949 [Chlorella sorokiniana]|eukprot:PRW60661.1 hypothetical protein C2E21_0949 [Chlorella sorokiniana]
MRALLCRLPPLLALLALSLTAVAADWKQGRASYYGTDGWSIHKGNCGFGYISQDQPAGWDVAALSDQFPNFAGSCGRCYEVKCDSRWVKDGYGASFDRTHVCYDPSASLLLRIVDSCPCNYPSNWYSNKRWCCGDADHMDISIWAFEKLADKKWGVIPIQYREVPCSYQPPKPAPAISNPTPGEYWSQTDNFMQTGDMSTPKIWNYQQADKMVQGWQFGDPTGSSSARASSSASSSASPANTGSSSGDKGTVFSGSLQNGWWDASYNAKVSWQAGNFGSSGGNVVCADLYGSGALAVSHSQGGFQGAGGLEFWMKTDGGRPQVTINIGGGSRYCTPKPLGQLSVLESRGSYSKFALSLGELGGSYTSFQGCGGNGWWDLTTIELKSTIGSTQTVCLDSIRLLPGSSSSRRRSS